MGVTRLILAQRLTIEKMQHSMVPSLPLRGYGTIQKIQKNRPLIGLLNSIVAGHGNPGLISVDLIHSEAQFSS